jgi:hypothetical protein
MDAGLRAQLVWGHPPRNDGRPVKSDASRAADGHDLPDVRDGLTRIERVVLQALAEAARDQPGRSVSAAEIYGRVCEHVALSPRAFEALLRRLHGGGRR